MNVKHELALFARRMAFAICLISLTVIPLARVEHGNWVVFADGGLAFLMSVLAIPDGGKL